MRQPGGSEQTLLGRLFSYYGPAEGESKGQFGFCWLESPTCFKQEEILPLTKYN